ncbi:DUF1707 SHOCT-like domain-containing protein [Phytoactinopolyspora limicola]|uniref:DUF1707 SHOCT-like domain-containing protein n=1 Tax=Phytoactinopolyspora limicola TaxID=2715536 RepID=UPI00140BAE9D|nr:DUF1707 domain-containing protein [Phytoactinopolyspora limicola]
MASEGSLRIGDAERDTAAAALGEHYAAGRLTKAEYDDRLETIWKARFGTDLQPAFADLPSTHPVAPAGTSGRTERTASGRVAPARTRPRSARPRWSAPVLVIGFLAVAFVALQGAPWLALIAFWFLACGGFGHRHRHIHRHGHHHA